MITQEAIADLERVKAELAQSIQRKEREFGAVMAKIEDEGSLGTKQQKQIKELSVSNFGCITETRISGFENSMG